jgi:hypothetical protein
MLKMGVPKQAVANKMTSKGVDSSVLDKDPESMVPDPSAAPPAPESTAPALIKLGEHPEYAQWFKMLKMGVPKQAVANKMSMKGVDASVLDKDPESMVPDPSATALPTAAPEPTAPTLIKLGEHPEYAQWFKMLKMGVPKQAVANKMTAKGVDSSVLDKDPESMVSDPTAAAPAGGATQAPPMIKLGEHPEYAQWFKMLKMGVPKQAVANKMTAKGVDASVLDKDPESMVPDPSAASPAAGATQAPVMIKLGEHPEYAQWFKMLKMGVPKQAVANKMTAKGVDASVLDQDPESMVPDPTASPPAGGPSAPPVLIKLGEHPEYAQWFKMLKMGVPKQAVANKMTAKGVDSSVLDKDPESMVPDPSAAAPAEGATASKGTYDAKVSVKQCVVVLWIQLYQD